MPKPKRVTLLCGHYGSGKTNVAVNWALFRKQNEPHITVADLDIVNPYFRTLDSREELEKSGIPLICSAYANTNVDLPSLPPELYTVTDDRKTGFVLDIGGDDRGALVLGRLAPFLRAEDNYDMWMVINRFRPLTPDVEATLEILAEIEQAGGLAFTGIVNNSNLGTETTPQEVLSSVDYAEAVAEASGLPLVMTTVRADLYESLSGKINNLFPLRLQANH